MMKSRGSPTNHAVGFHLPQLLDEHFLRNSWDSPLQLREAQHCSIEQVKEKPSSLASASLSRVEVGEWVRRSSVVSQPAARRVGTTARSPLPEGNAANLFVQADISNSLRFWHRTGLRQLPEVSSSSTVEQSQRFEISHEIA
jgi:hypothetical protein